MLGAGGLLLGVELLLLGYFRLRLRALMLMREAAATGGAAPSRLDACLLRAMGPGMDAARLEAQLAFLTDRYDSHCPWWQYPIWARQFALELTAVLPDLFEPESDAHEATTWAHAGVAVLVLVASLAWHTRVLPFVCTP